MLVAWHTEAAQRPARWNHTLSSPPPPQHSGMPYSPVVAVRDEVDVALEAARGRVVNAAGRRRGQGTGLVQPSGAGMGACVRRQHLSLASMLLEQAKLSEMAAI